MAISLIQHKLSSVTNGSFKNVVSFTTNPTAGHLVIVAISYFGGGSDYFKSLGDNQTGNTYTQVGPTRTANTNQDYLRLYYAKNINSSGTFTITADFSNGSPGTGDTNVVIYDYSGADTVAPLDTTNPGATGSGTGTAAGNVTPTVANCLVFSAGVDDGGGNNNTPTANTGQGFALEDHQDDSSSHERIYTEDLIQTTAVQVNGSFTAGGGNWAAQEGVFKPSAGSSVSPSVSVSPSKSVSPSASASPSVSPSISVSPSKSVSPSVSPSVSISPSISVSPSISPSVSISPSKSASPSVSPSVSISPSVSVSPSISPSISVSPSSSVSPSVSPSISVSPSASVSPSISPSISVSPSISPSISVSPSISPSSSTSPSVSPSVSSSPSVSPSVSPSAAASGGIRHLMNRFQTRFIR